ncbi:MAG: YdcF family protein [Candidatus Velamenicoccus archaeovorus]
MGVLRRHLVLSVLAILLAAVVGTVLTTGVAVWRAAHQDDASRVPSADVIVVLGAAQYDGRPSPVFTGRLEHARLLFEQQRAPLVMVLGAGRPGDASTEAEAGRDFLVAAGVPPDAVVAEPVGHTTLESLRGAAVYMRAHGLRSAFLVSDPWHNLRVERMASDLGIVGYASATWHSAARSEETRFEGYLRETFAYLYYRLLGR